MLRRVHYYPVGDDGWFQVICECAYCGLKLEVDTPTLLEGMDIIGVWLVGETMDGKYPHGSQCEAEAAFRRLLGV